MDEDDFQEHLASNDDDVEEFDNNLQEIKNDYDEARDLVDRYKKLKDSSNAAHNISKEGTKQAGKEAAKEGAKQGVKQAGKEAGKETAKQAGKEVAKEGAKQGAKQAEKAGAKAGVKVAGEAVSGPVGWVLLAVDAAALLVKRIKKFIKKSPEEKLKDGVKKSLPIFVILGILLLPVAAIALYTSVGYTVTTGDSIGRLNEYINCVESSLGCIDQDKAETDYTGYNGFNNVEVEGKGKSILTFKYDEIDEVAQNYSNIADKYFEYGEGLDFKDENTIISEIKDEMGRVIKPGTSFYELRKGMIANFMTLKARAFSKIKWYTRRYEGEELKIKEIPESDMVELFKSDEDSIRPVWLTWFDASEYVIKIPDPEKFTFEEVTTVKSLKVDGEEMLKEIIPTTLSFNGTSLDEYLKILADYLPDWSEPYAIYLATGDLVYAAECYKQYLNLIETDEPLLKVYLNKVEIEYDSTQTGTTHKKITETRNGNTSVLVDKIADVKIESHVTLDNWAPTVQSGYAFTAVYYDTGARLKKYIDYEEVVEGNFDGYRDIQLYFEGEGEKKKQVGGRYTFIDPCVTKNEKVYQKRKIVEYDDPLAATYCELITGKRVIDPTCEYYMNTYINMRISYVCYLITQTIEQRKFDLDLIGPAVEVVSDYYKRMKESGSSTTTATSQTGTPANSGESNNNAGYRNTFTSSNGTNYREYEQNTGYYAGETYTYSGGSGTFAKVACPVVAAATFLQGYGVYIDPYELYKKRGYAGFPHEFINLCGVGTAIEASYNRNKAIQILSSGKPIAIQATGALTTCTHYMAVLDYNPETGLAYVSGGNSGVPSGWYNLDSLGIGNMYYIP